MPLNWLDLTQRVYLLDSPSPKTCVKLGISKSVLISRLGMVTHFHESCQLDVKIACHVSLGVKNVMIV